MAAEDVLGKKVLIAGWQCFWWEALQRLFAKEGWDYYALPLNPGQEEEGQLKFLEPLEIFRVQNIPIVMFSLGRTRMDGGEGKWLSELNELLALSHKYNVQHFFLLSSLRALPREGQTEPCSQSARLAEDTVLAWQKTSGLQVTILRTPEIYGTGETAQEGLLAEWLQAAETGDVCTGFIDTEGQRDFLYVDDAVYGIYRAVARGYAGEPLNLMSGSAYTAAEALEAVRQATGKGLTLAEGQEIFSRPLPKPEAAQKELGWSAKYALQEGLRLTVEGERALAKAQVEADKVQERKEKLRALKEKLIPYGENILGALLMALIAYWQDGSPVNPWIYFDVNFVYIGVMGLLYGKRQALLAMAFSSVILLVSLLLQGANAVALLYMPRHLLHFISYIFVAVATGYFADGRTYEREAAAWQASQAQERYDFLRSLYDENVAVKDKLYRQIVNSDDSIGRLYRIIRQLDSVATENIFTQAASVTAQVLAVEDIAVYVMGKGGYFLRQKVRMGRLAQARPHSLRVEDHAYLRNLVQEKSIYVNRELVKDTPDLAAPIVYQDEVIAVIEIFGMSFEQWSLYQQNLLSITTRLISSSMGRAYQYEAEVQERRYHAGTRVLKEPAFRAIIQEFRDRRLLQGELEISVLRVDMAGLDYTAVDERCGRLIRNEDFMGELEGNVYLLLPDADESVKGMVQERLRSAGLITESDGTVV